MPEITEQQRLVRAIAFTMYNTHTAKDAISTSNGHESSMDGGLIIQKTFGRIISHYESKFNQFGDDDNQIIKEIFKRIKLLVIDSLIKDLDEILTIRSTQNVNDQSAIPRRELKIKHIESEKFIRWLQTFSQYLDPEKEQILDFKVLDIYEWLQANKDILINEDHPHHERILTESRKYLKFIFSNHMIAWRNFDPDPDKIYKDQNTYENFFAVEAQNASNYTVTVTFPENSTRIMLEESISLRKILAYYYLVVTEQDPNILPQSERENTLRELIYALADCRRAHNVSNNNYGLESPHKYDLKDRVSCIAGTRGRLSEIGTKHSIAKTQINPMNLASSYAQQEINNKLRASFNHDHFTNSELEDYLESMDFSKKNLQDNRGNLIAVNDLINHIEINLQQDQDILALIEYRIEIFRRLGINIEATIEQQRVIFSDDSIFEAVCNKIRNEFYYLNPGDQNHIRLMVNTYVIDPYCVSGSADLRLEHIFRANLANSEDQNTSTNNQVTDLAENHEVSDALSEQDDIDYIAMSPNNPNLSISYNANSQFFEDDLLPYTVREERAIGINNNRNMFRIVRGNIEMNRSYYGPYSDHIRYNNIPLVLPYNPTGNNDPVAYDGGIVTSLFAIKIPEANLNNLPEGMSNLLRHYQVNYNNLELYFNVQNMPWNPNDQLLLRLHPLVHADAPMSIAQRYDRNSNVYAGIFAVDAQVENLAQIPVQTHNNYPADNRVVFSPDHHARIIGCDPATSHAFYSVCIIPATGSIPTRAAITLHWLLNQLDYNYLVDVIHTRNMIRSPLNLRQIVESITILGDLTYLNTQTGNGITLSQTLVNLCEPDSSRERVNINLNPNNRYRLAEQPVNATTVSHIIPAPNIEVRNTTNVVRVNTSSSSSSSSSINLIDSIAATEFELLRSNLEQHRPILTFSPRIANIIVSSNLIEQVVNNVEPSALDCPGMLELIRISPTADRALNLRMYF